MFVAVGRDEARFSSPDGINWTKRRFGQAYQVELRAAAYGLGYFVTNRKISSDGISWTSANHGLNDMIFTD